MAAIVVKDSYRLPTHSLGARGTLRRTLRLEVLWCTVSSSLAAEHVLNKGSVLERDEANLSEYEMYRTEWRDEAGRLPEVQERQLCRRLLF